MAVFQIAGAQDRDGRYLSSTDHTVRSLQYLEKGTSLERVLDTIEREYEVIFLYKSGLLDGKVLSERKRLDLQGNLYDTLNDVLEDFHLAYNKLTHRTLGIFPARNNIVQQHKVSGTVTDAVSGETLPGVNVIIKGTSTGTSTNLDGKYELVVSSLQDTLIFSFVGFESREIAINGRVSLDIELTPQTISGDEVIVVGYGVQEKVSVTGAVSQISTPDTKLQKIATPSLTNMIGGMIPGIITRQNSGEPGYDQAQVFIRGQSTFGNSNPLILVDGVERSMNDINPQQIESFTILKDASATAVYGARGANGVILIETKRGKPGKPHVTFRSETTQLTALRLPNYIDGAAFAGLVNEANSHVGLEPVYTEEEIQKYRDGSDPYFYPNINWTDEVLKEDTYQSLNNLSVTGGNEYIRYYTNVGYTKQEGIYKQDENLKKYRTNALAKKYNFRANLDAYVSDNLSLFLGVGGIIRTGHYPGVGANRIFESLKIISPIEFPVTNPDGSVAGGPSYLGENPWGLVTQSGYSIQERHEVQSTFKANWDLSSLVTEGLALSGKFAYDYYNFAGIDRNITYELKEYQGKDANGEDIYNLVREGHPMGYAPFTADNNRTFYFEGLINYKRVFLDRHDVGGMLLFNQREHIQINAGNSTLALPYRRRGLSGRVTYGYDHRYQLEFNFGYNGSENFPKGKKFGFFPSVSGGWVISNETFWNVPFISLLKLRGSYGAVGNDQIGGNRFLFLTTITKDANIYRFGDSQQVYHGFDEGNIGNPNVSWETSIKKNVGLDLNLLEDKISLQVNAFDELRKDILMQRQTIPRVTGFFPWIIPYGNIGEIKNRGVDGRLEIQNTTSGDFYYSLSGNFTFARNKIVENDEPAKEYEYQSAIGQSLGAPFGLKAIGFFKDQEDIDQSPSQAFSSTLYPGDIKYEDVNDDGVVDAYDRVFLDGYPRMPEITFGFGGTVAWKGIELSLFFTGATNTSLFLQGPSIYPFQRGPGSYNILEEYYNNRWTPETKESAKYPAVTPGDNTNNFRASSVYLRDGSYIRLKNAEIAYTVPRQFTQKMNIASCRFFINGTNLLTFDKLGFMNPESNSGTGGYPLQRGVNLGLQLDFK